MIFPPLEPFKPFQSFKLPLSKRPLKAPVNPLFQLEFEQYELELWVKKVWELYYKTIINKMDNYYNYYFVLPVGIEMLLSMTYRIEQD